MTNAIVVMPFTAITTVSHRVEVVVRIIRPAYICDEDYVIMEYLEFLSDILRYSI